ncbi:glycosyl hydrolase family 28-related protein [Cronobacter sakazakii]|uniref:glycosyl hydrolase family 28-related protein n=1 Tax=Cronobacter sakazakii TaxID=28141 RepID=UPI003D02ADB6
MTVSTEVDHNDYTGNGATTNFDYTFRVFKKTDLVVSVLDLDNNLTELILDTDYTVTGAGGYNGGKVILSAPLANGWKISISRDVPLTQETDLRNQGSFFPEVHEDAFDKLTMLIQQVWSRFTLALRKPSSLANWYDALGNYIRNLKDPRDPQDAATKNYVDTVSVGNFYRTLRVPDPFIAQLPPLSDLEGKVIGIVGGQPVGLVPSSGSASDVLIELAKQGSDKRIGSSYGGTVYTDYQPSQLRKKYQFGIPGNVYSQREAVFYPAENLWYISKVTVFPVTIPSSPDSNWRCVGRLNGYPIYDVRNWGLVGDDFTDNTSAFTTMIAKNAGYPGELYFPAGTYRYADIGAITLSRFTFRGDGSMRSRLRCTNTTPGHTALDINAWPDPVNPNQPFIDSFNIIGLHIEGNSNTLKVLRMQGCSRCKWSDVTIWGARSTDGVGLSIEACSINQFDSIYVSKYRNLVGQTTNVPFYGLVITTGYRAGAFQASSTNNVFTSCGWEGVTRGCLLTYADGTLMLAGTSEANLEYDLAIQVGCRFNSFINFAMDSVAATFNAQDRGEYSYFKNCYSNKLFYIGQNSKSSEISGGYYQQITTQTGSVDAKIHDLTVGNWGATVGDGVNTDLGSGHISYSIYNKSIPDFINTTGIRQAAALTTTPVSGGTNGVWDNTTRLPVTLYINNGGGFTQALILRGGAGGDAVGIPLTGTQQVHLEAKDRISLTWATGVTAPVCSYREKSGFN